ncbi:MAG TPA: lectin-like protein [Phycisphaerae bacterium]|nr:lectin-like protein [Phycisphaerae bacterium]
MCSCRVGRQGYLATVTSEEENRFLVAALGGPDAVDMCWLGGYQDTLDPSYSEPSGGWKWITGEPWLCTNWLPGEPNDSWGFGTENCLEYYYHSAGWNDKVHDMLWELNGYVVEYAPEPTSALLLAVGSLVVRRGRR